jgi:hypothetical protein
MKNIHQKEYSAEKITQTNGSNVAKKTSLILALALAA